MDLWVVFLTGIFGSLGCMAVQGGLLASVIATQNTQGPVWKKTIGIISFFLVGKLIAYTLFGGMLGLVGSYVVMTIPMRIVFMVVASCFMIAAALNLLSVHPLFRLFVIQPPRFFYSLARKHSRQADYFAPLVVGMLTLFLPCGTTQAIMVQALQFGNPILSASILFVFTIGTIPIFILFGVLMQAASKVLTRSFTVIAALLVLSLALWNLTNAFALAGFDLARSARVGYCQIVYCDDLVGNTTEEPRQTTTQPIITIQKTSYTLDNPYIRAGSTVTLTVKNVRGSGCIQFFTIPKLQIQKSIPIGSEETITFTAPQEKGELPFMCSMGMYRGTFIVE